MSMTRVRVRRDRPTALAWAVALCVTMLVVYVLTLNAGGPDVVESMAAAPRVTREIEFDALEGWCVAMGECDSDRDARLLASGYVGRGAAGYVTEMDGAWRVLGAVYAGEKDARRIADRLARDEGIPAEALEVSAQRVKLRVTAPQQQIDAIAGADALLRRQTEQLGQIALQLDRGELRPDGAKTLCALAAGEAGDAAAALAAIPGAAENDLCAGLIDRLETLGGLLQALADSDVTGAETLSGMARCAQVENFLGQAELMDALKGR